MSNIKALLRSHPATRGLTDEEIQQVAGHATVVECPQGHVLCEAGKNLDSVYLIVLGRFSANVPQLNGNDRPYHYLRSGEQVGLMASETDDTFPLNIVADEPSVVLDFSAQSARELADTYPLLRRNLFRLASGQISQVVVSSEEKRQDRLVAFLHTTSEASEVVYRVLNRLTELGEDLALASDDSRLIDRMSLPSLTLKRKDGELLPGAEIREQIGQWADVKRIVFSGSQNVELNKCAALIGFVDETFWILTPQTWRQAHEAIAKLVAQTPTWKRQINLIWLLPNKELIAPHVPELQELVNRQFKIHLCDEQSSSSSPNKGLERIVHYLRGVQLGIALGGGAAKGMAHLGVFNALENAGLTCDMMAGTSSGAMTSVVYAAGKSPAWSVNRFAEDLTLPWYFRKMPSGGLWYLITKYRRRAWDGMLRKYLEDLQLEQLPLPMYTVAVDLVSGEQIVRERGDAVKAILESINLPILSPPINEQGKSIIDGGYLNVLPADVLFKNGATFVIAVNVSSQINQEFIGNHPDTPKHKMRSASIWQTMKRLRTVQDRFTSFIGSASADYTIEPDVSSFDITEFPRAAEIAAVGQRAAEKAVPEIFRMLSRIDSDLFRP